MSFLTNLVRKKPITHETLRIVTALRESMAALRSTLGDLPVARVMGEAVSRLCLLDAALHRQRVFVLWCNDMILGVYSRSSTAISGAEAFMRRPEQQGEGWEWKQLPGGGYRWHCREVARLQVEEWPVQGGPPLILERN